MIRYTRFVLSFCLATGLAAGLAGCVTNPTTGRSQFNALSRDEEISMGTQAMPDLVQEYGGAVRDPNLQNYVTNIGRQLASVTEADNPTLPWEFTLLDSDVINAFAMPGGKVFISRGLAAKMTNEAQLAGVLGHEVGHVTARHINDAITRQQGVEVGAGLLGILAGAVSGGNQQERDQIASGIGTAVTVGGGVVLLRFSRDQEHEADSLGIRYMTKLNYNPIGQMQVMQILAGEAGGGAGSEWLATHPFPENRVERIKGMLAREYAFTQNNPQFQLYEERFRTQFLSKLALLDPPAHRSPRAFALGNPATWCAHCAAAAESTPIQ